jgi:AbrB family looped-hinge helix DNA binding protein
MYNISTVTAKGMVVIPKAIRERHSIKVGDRVAFVDYTGTIALVPILEDPVAALCGMLKGGPSIADGLLKDRQEDLEREERKIAEDIRRLRKSEASHSPVMER